MLVAVRDNWGEDRVFFLDEEGTQCSLPRGWTDAADPDPFVALAAGRSALRLNPRPEAVTDEAFRESEFLDARDLVQVKYEMVRRVRLEGEPVSRAARAFGFSRPSFYQARAALEQGGLPALVPARPGPRRAHKLSEEVVAFAQEQLEADPTLRSADLVAAIEKRFGVRVHPRSVERALARAARPKKRWRASRTGIGSGSRCSSGAVLPPGLAPGRRRRRKPSPPTSLQSRAIPSWPL